MPLLLLCIHEARTQLRTAVLVHTPFGLSPNVYSLFQRREAQPLPGHDRLLTAA